MKWMSRALVMSLCVLFPAQLMAEEPAPAEETKPAEDPWAHKINLDHPGFTDSAYVMEKDHAQVEMGFGVAGGKDLDTVGSFEMVGRFDIVDHVEARFEVPNLTFNMADFNQFNMDTFEAGAKVGGELNSTVALAALPYVIIPMSNTSQLDTISGGMSLLADLHLSKSLDITISVTPRLMNYRLSDNRPNADESGDLAFELDGALLASFHVSERFSVFAEGWFNYLGDKNIGPVPSSRSFKPAADAGVILYVTPNAAFDLNFGSRDLGDTNTLYGTLGFSVRVL
jgi:hypothetical protein